jgi:hypothetical protein
MGTTRWSMRRDARIVPSSERGGVSDAVDAATGRSRAPSRLGLRSIIVGAGAIASVRVAHVLERYGANDRHVLFDFADRHGLMNPPREDDVRMLKPASLFELTDENAILLILVFGILLALTAMALALWADRRGEPNLYAAGGFICGALALALTRYVGGLVATCIGLGLLGWQRRRALKLAAGDAREPPSRPCGPCE